MPPDHTPATPSVHALSAHGISFEERVHSAAPVVLLNVIATLIILVMALVSVALLRFLAEVRYATARDLSD